MKEREDILYDEYYNKKIEDDDDDEYEYLDVDYNDLSLEELQEICEDRKIKIYKEYSKKEIIELLKEYDEDLEEEDISAGISDFSFKLISIFLFILIFIIVAIICKELLFTKEIEIDKMGNEYMNVKTMALNKYEEGKNEKVEDFFVKNITVSNKLSEKDKEFLDSLFTNEDIVDEESFKEAAQKAILYLNDKDIVTKKSKYSYKAECTLINPMEEYDANYIFVDINYSKNGTFFLADDEIVVTYIIL